MQDKIISAIAAYLEGETEFRVDFVDGKKNEQVYFRNAKCSDSFLQEISTKLAAAIAPHLEAGADYPYSELSNHMSSEHGLTLTNTELGDIIYIARK